MSKHKTLLKILTDGKVHSGVNLGKKLGMTRAGIWKSIQELKALEINIVAKTNQGYCIPHGIELFDIRKINAQLNIPNLPIKIFDVLPSTNTYLIERAREGLKNIRVCLTEYQPQGRGRFGRKWFSPFGKNIAMSLLWSFEGDLNRLAGLSLVAAVAVAHTLKKYGVKKGLGLKWPNDVLWQGKKLAGILIELHGESHYACDAVIGIGVNGEISKVLRKKTKIELIDIHEITQKPLARNRFIALLLQELYAALTRFQTYGLTPFISDWQALDVAVDRPIELILDKKIIRGIYRGIDPACGTLLMEDTKGNLQSFSSGEVSLRVKYSPHAKKCRKLSQED